MKPFVLLSTRPEDAAALDEHATVARLAGLTAEDLVQIRVGQAPLVNFRLADFAGVFLGGSPFNAGDSVKSDLQLAAERTINQIIDEVVAQDFPFLGLCYGIGALTVRLGGVVDRTYGEEAGAVMVSLTDQAHADPVFGSLPQQLTAFVGHKEACRSLPEGAVLLATGQDCPVQAFRIGSRVWATQFHPELDGPAMARRVQIYQHAGYFAPDELEQLMDFALSAPITVETHAILSNFVAFARAFNQ